MLKKQIPFNFFILCCLSIIFFMHAYANNIPQAVTTIAIITPEQARILVGIS